jgi:hypothetical protein
MNERIQELLIEAHKQTNGGIYNGHLSEWTEKFAEMIVRECIGVVENLSPGYADYRNQIEDAFRRDCVEKVKEHFGVE